MKTQKSNIARNLSALRQLNKFSQEEVAERIGVSRQAVAKWEAGQSAPDILNCDALAKLYDVELDDLVHYDPERSGGGIPPRGKHIFGIVRVGERGQIVLPKQARDVFKLSPGDRLEAEKAQQLLTAYRAKRTLCAKEAETLNDILAALLKMMAKYQY